MNSDQSPAAHRDLHDRARLYGALADPARLAIVDHLALGDASPGELASLIDQPTNLMAHHLRVLSEAGIVRRVRSEGDRRRTYVQLCCDDPTVAALVVATVPVAAQGTPPTPVAGAARVVFLCTHNSARSQLAAALWAQESEIPGASAGTHPAAAVHPRAIATGSRHGLQVGTAPRTLADVLRPQDVIVAVCDNAYEELGPVEGGARLHWSIPDPARIDTDEAFESAYERLAPRVRRLAGALVKRTST